MADTHVYLVPGFFGFTSIGALEYFYRVAETLEHGLQRRGVEARVLECQTQPTGSISRRANRLIDHVIASQGLEARSLHFIGHSTGGLDIRLLATPGVRLRSDDSEERIGDLTRSVITVTTPHFGTPVANFFTTLLGRQLLEMLTLFATSTPGRYSIFVISRVLRSLARLDDRLGRDETFLDWLVHSLLRRVITDPDDPLWAFLREVAADQGAIIQLTPESMHLFNAAVTDRPDVRYGSLVAAAPPPPSRYSTRDLLSLSRAARMGVFTLLYFIAGRAHSHYPYPGRTIEELDEICCGLTIDDRSNDGIVPSLSQAYGDILDVVVADHLDVIGQFPGASDDPYSDWLPSGAEFDEERFQGVWDRVAGAIAAAER